MLRNALAMASVVVLASSGCATPSATVLPSAPSAPLVLPSVAPPSAEREFRAAWIATVANIDWPTERGLSADQQREEMVVLLDEIASLRLNAVIFQVRPMADALYDSGLEPWSSFLTGEQGRSPGYDPLAYAIEQAHLRGIELHAWFNPFRAGHPTNEGSFADGHVSQRHPDWVRSYGEQLWLDPGHPEAVAHSLAVIADVVRRYDVDGVHVDDYFYPYAVQDSAGQDMPFPDSQTWAAARFEGTRDDWRRSNVDHFVERMYETVKAIRPAVKVGISPFGIWRPGYPEGVVGFDQYEGLYADARRWLREGWVDYFTPQIYWKLDSPGQPYGPLLDWWVDENIHGRHLWPGNYASRVIMEGSAHWDPNELVQQVHYTRGNPGATGNVFFSIKALMPGHGAFEMLADSVYSAPAVMPPTSWLGGATPGPPYAARQALSVILEPGSGDPPFVWHVREWTEGGWHIRVIPGHNRTIEYPEGVPPFVVVSGINRLGQEGPSVWVIPGGSAVE